MNAAASYLAGLTAAELATHRAWVADNITNPEKRAAMLDRIDRTTPATPDPRDVITRNQRARFNFQGPWDGADPDNRPGELLTMGDGSQWFHAYSGKAPVQITDANRSGLTISA